MAQSYQDRVVADGAQYYWRLGEVSGTTAVDRVSGVNGTISGGVTLNVLGGIEGNGAMTFNGTTGKVQTAAQVTIPPVCTFEVWVKTAVDGVLFATVPTGNGDQFVARLALQRVEFYIDYTVGTDASTSGSRSIADGQWHHVVCVFRSSAPLLEIYIDGEKDAMTVPMASALTGIARPLVIGYDAAFSGLYLAGSLDDLAIYPRVLTSAQIRDHYTLGVSRTPYAPGSYPALVLKDGARNYWRLGESSGTTAVDVVSGVNGTISGGVTLGQAGALGDGDKAMRFDGASGKIQTAANVLVPVTCTIEGWLNGPSGVNNIVFSTRNIPGATGDTLALRVENGGSLSLLTGALQASSAPGLVTPNIHHHLVAVMTASETTLYYDGAVAATNPAVVRTVPSGGPCTIGWDTGVIGATGVIDEVAIYPLALSAAQIAAHYTARTLPYVPGTYPARVIASGPSNYWRLGESSGATAVDLVGGANGTISGGVTLGQKGALSEPDTAMGFDGASGKIVSPNLTMTPPFTWETWMRSTSTSGERPVLANMQVAFAGKDSSRITLNAGGGLYLNLYFADNSATGTTASGPVNDGQWHHLVAVFQAARVDLYVDGLLSVSLATGVHFTTPTAQPLTFAFNAGEGTWLPGSLDDVAVYPRVLPAGEILDHYNAKLADMWDPRLYPPTSPPTTGPVAYPAVTSPYPQPPGTPEYAPRPAPTLATLTPSSVSVGASDGFLEMTLTGTGFTNASRVSFAGILDHPRVDDTITYVNPTTLLMTLDVRTPPATLPPATYQLGIVNQDSQSSATLPLTVSA